MSEGEGEMTLYARLGDERIRRLVDRFYDQMDTVPECATIRAMHPADLSSSRDKLYWFLVGWSGGPPLYVERYGHPRLRARHLPFSIGDAEALQWMHCMRMALDETVPEPHLRSLLEAAFGRIAGHMRNREDGAAGP
jgi:hemoglobin